MASDDKALIFIVFLLILPPFAGLAFDRYTKEQTKQECYKAVVALAKEAAKFDDAILKLKCD